ncbi:hypothetical protein PHSY_001167 [Pseudozyma hubeiensis SY62]|uniref:Hepatocellular carcinoma-associated antigen 59-domain-containing protein n=1 Tax=Pseudozyma hubeiensis (strain SY62) TaxID=1305764 RepID=R9NYB4_PSEHS|nr:hypothetical protein PHSY_001167 [Pseudozyma hubeiensis SY62]GAC93602.1 hypothetical protein PHSY_001167 [Pseudozyma hubeiensis SY62]
MSDQSSQAGPSSTPLFKKRSKAHSTSRISSSVIDDQPSTSTTPPESTNDDEDLSVADLIALRSLSRKPTGTELERLNKGERRRKKGQNSKTASQLEEERWEQQMKNGGLMDRAEEESDDDADANKPRRLVRKNNFQGETGTVDVDKHMMAYIQQEMSKRNPHSSAIDDETATDTAATANPQDSLYALAEKYRQLQRSVKPELSEEQREGNVALSSQMLTSVPEVDLGIDTRMNNIQQTEAAKRKLAEQQRTSTRDESDSAYAQARFQHAKPRNEGGYAKQMATDQVVLDRFRKRQRNFR